MPFQLETEYKPAGDQKQAIAKLAKSLHVGNRHQTLMGVTGSGKTFTMANLIQEVSKPTLIMSHNKTLAAQLYSEFKNFFPNNAVEYFVSYFDYYQPEAYIPRSDTYIDKDSKVNDEIERLRLSTMGSLLTRQDTIVVASVSCIYGLGSPEDYVGSMLPIYVGQEIERDEFLKALVDLMFERNDFEFGRGKFRVRGDCVDVHPAYLDKTAIRVEFFGDEIDRISEVSLPSGLSKSSVDSYTFFPAKQFVSNKSTLQQSMRAIRKEMEDRIAYFESHEKLVEAQRLKMRTEYDLEMFAEVGYCQGVENYSRHLTGRSPGETPYTLLDFFPDDFLLLVDESHATLPQVRGMYEGDKSRKTTLVEHGFRLPSAMDNRPLKFEEFVEKVPQSVYVSATPGPFELVNSRSDVKGFISIAKKGEEGIDPFMVRKMDISSSGNSEPIESFDPEKRGRSLIVEQIIRPTGLLDPVLTLRPLEGQIDETIELCRQRVERRERVLVTTLTKKTAEDLTEYLKETGLKVRYLHADIDTVERVEILRALRAAEFDILVGINLLREGLDLPEVSLVCILDADKEGFLRNETSLIQTAGRAARHSEGECYLFCDTVTDSIQRLIDVTDYRREKQIAHNTLHGITPKSVVRPVQQSLQQYNEAVEDNKSMDSRIVGEEEALYNKTALLMELEKDMIEAANKLDFEKAAHLRDQIQTIKKTIES